MFTDDIINRNLLGDDINRIWKYTHEEKKRNVFICEQYKYIIQTIKYSLREKRRKKMMEKKVAAFSKEKKGGKMRYFADAQQ